MTIRKPIEKRLNDVCKCNHTLGQHDWTAAYSKPCLQFGCSCGYYHKKTKKRELRELKITPKDIQVYNFIKSYWIENGCGPNYREVAKIAGVSSPSNGQRYIDKLIEHGYLVIGKRPNGKQRISGSIRITDKRPEWYSSKG